MWAWCYTGVVGQGRSRNFLFCYIFISQFLFGHFQNGDTLTTCIRLLKMYEIIQEILTSNKRSFKGAGVLRRGQEFCSSRIWGVDDGNDSIQRDRYIEVLRNDIVRTLCQSMSSLSQSMCKLRYTHKSWLNNYKYNESQTLLKKYASEHNLLSVSVCLHSNYRLSLHTILQNPQ